MNREYHHWESAALGRTMEMLVFGHAGDRVLVFPSRCGRFFEYEDKGMVHALEPQIEAGLLQLFCVDSMDAHSVYCLDIPPQERIRQHQRYERHILDEVLPFTAKLNPSPKLVAHGCSLGAFHAMNVALRHPQHFHKVVAFSGRYDLTRPSEEFTDLFEGHYNEDIYFHTPAHFMPNLTDPLLLELIRKMEILLVVGEEDPFYPGTHEFCDVLNQKEIPYTLHVWYGRAHRFRYWRQMARVYF